MKQTTSEEDEAAKVAPAAAAAAVDAVPIGRCLFPPVDRRQNRKDLRRLLRRIEDAQTIRWNFDFRECRPLEGRFQWKKPDDRKGGDDDDDGGLSTAASQIPDLPGHSVVPRCPAAVGCRMPGEDDGGEKRRGSALSPSASTGTAASSRVSPSSSSSSSASESRKTPGPTTAPGRRQSTLCRYYRVKKRRPERVK